MSQNPGEDPSKPGGQKPKTPEEQRRELEQFFTQNPNVTASGGTRPTSSASATSNAPSTSTSSSSKKRHEEMEKYLRDKYYQRPVSQNQPRPEFRPRQMSRPLQRSEMASPAPPVDDPDLNEEDRQRREMYRRMRSEWQVYRDHDESSRVENVLGDEGEGAFAREDPDVPGLSLGSTRLGQWFADRHRRIVREQKSQKKDSKELKKDLKEAQEKWKKKHKEAFGSPSAASGSAASRFGSPAASGSAASRFGSPAASGSAASPFASPFGSPFQSQGQGMSGQRIPGMSDLSGRMRSMSMSDIPRISAQFDEAVRSRGVPSQASPSGPAAQILRRSQSMSDLRRSTDYGQDPTMTDPTDPRMRSGLRRYHSTRLQLPGTDFGIERAVPGRLRQGPQGRTLSGSEFRRLMPSNVDPGYEDRIGKRLHLTSPYGVAEGSRDVVKSRLHDIKQEARRPSAQFGRGYRRQSFEKRAQVPMADKSLEHPEGVMRPRHRETIPEVEEPEWEEDWESESESESDEPEPE